MSPCLTLQKRDLLLDAFQHAAFGHVNGGNAHLQFSGDGLCRILLNARPPKGVPSVRFKVVLDRIGCLGKQVPQVSPIPLLLRRLVIVRYLSEHLLSPSVTGALRLAMIPSAVVRGPISDDGVQPTAERPRASGALRLDVSGNRQEHLLGDVSRIGFLQPLGGRGIDAPTARKSP